MGLYLISLLRWSACRALRSAGQQQRGGNTPACAAFTKRVQLRLCACSALGVLASSSGVSNERKVFMDLVKTEIGRLNKQLVNKGRVSLVFAAGGVQVPAPLRLQRGQVPYVPCACALRSCWSMREPHVFAASDVQVAMVSCTQGWTVCCHACQLHVMRADRHISPPHVEPAL